MDASNNQDSARIDGKSGNIDLAFSVYVGNSMTEDQLEQITVDWFLSQGYEYAYGPDIGHDGDAVYSWSGSPENSLNKFRFKHSQRIQKSEVLGGVAISCLTRKRSPMQKRRQSA
jgi:hypothetical protein